MTSLRSNSRNSSCSRKTSTRSISSTCSSSSVDSITTARPCCGERTEQRVEVVLGADVDPARRIVEQQDPWAESQPAGDDHLLLVAARQRRDPVLRRAEHDPETARRSPRAACRERRGDSIPLRVSRLERRQREVLADRHPAEQRIQAAFARHVGDVVVGGVRGRGDRRPRGRRQMTDDLALDLDAAAQRLEEQYCRRGPRGPQARSARPP